MKSTTTATEAAEQQRRRDIEFLSLMVHDLRQPLTVVLGMALSLDASWDELSDEHKRRYVASIVRGGKWLKTIVDDVLTAGEEVGGRSIEAAVSFSLSDLVDETIRDLAAQDILRVEHRHGADLPLAYGDPVRQRHVLQNLLDNAIKYSRSEMPIHVGLTVRNEMLVVTVADRGPGIKAVDAPTIFDRYTRVLDAEHVTTIEGSGLGLFVCKAMVTAGGGEIELGQNTHGIGSVFTYTIPTAPPLAS